MTTFGVIYLAILAVPVYRSILRNQFAICSFIDRTVRTHMTKLRHSDRIVAMSPVRYSRVPNAESTIFFPSAPLTDPRGP